MAVTNFVVISRGCINGNESVFSMHASGCKDIERDIRKHGGFESLRIQEANYKLAEKKASDEMNADFIAEGGDENRWPIDVHPCCKR